MSTFYFICPHCGYSQQLPSKTDGLHGKCPSCNEDVVVRSKHVRDRSSEVVAYWFVLSSGLDPETPEKLTEPQIVELINAGRIGPGADVLKPDRSPNEWVKLKDTHLNAYVEQMHERKRLAKEERKSEVAAKRETKKMQEAKSRRGSNKKKSNCGNTRHGRLSKNE